MTCEYWKKDNNNAFEAEIGFVFACYNPSMPTPGGCYYKFAGQEICPNYKNKKNEVKL